MQKYLNAAWRILQSDLLINFSSKWIIRYASQDSNRSGDWRKALGTLFAYHRFCECTYGLKFTKYTDHLPLWTAFGSERYLSKPLTDYKNEPIYFVSGRDYEDVELMSFKGAQKSCDFV